MNRAFSLLAMLVVFGVASVVSAHGGGLDRNGGHHNRKTGEYHCHREPCFSNQERAEKRDEKPKKKRETKDDAPKDE